MTNPDKVLITIGSDFETNQQFIRFDIFSENNVSSSAYIKVKPSSLNLPYRTFEVEKHLIEDNLLKVIDLLKDYIISSNS